MIEGGKYNFAEDWNKGVSQLGYFKEIFCWIGQSWSDLIVWRFHEILFKLIQSSHHSGVSEFWNSPETNIFCPAGMMSAFQIRVGNNSETMGTMEGFYTNQLCAFSGGVSGGGLAGPLPTFQSVPCRRIQTGRYLTIQEVDPAAVTQLTLCDVRPIMMAWPIRHQGTTLYAWRHNHRCDVTILCVASTSHAEWQGLNMNLIYDLREYSYFQLNYFSSFWILSFNPHHLPLLFSHLFEGFIS